MNLFLYKLLPPRLTFATDMTDTEKKVMQEHATYWKGLLEKGIVIVVGLFLTPKAPWGLAIVGADNEQNVRTFGTNDPAVKSGLAFEIHPMRPNSIVRQYG